MIVELLQEYMSLASGLPLAEILNTRCRHQPLPACRFMIWAELRDMHYSYAEIGRLFCKTHATILHGVRIVDECIKTGVWQREYQIYCQFKTLIGDKPVFSGSSPESPQD